MSTMTRTPSAVPVTRNDCVLLRANESMGGSNCKSVPCSLIVNFGSGSGIEMVKMSEGWRYVSRVGSLAGSMLASMSGVMLKIELSDACSMRSRRTDV